MTAAAELDMRRLAERTLGTPIVAAGAFHTVADVGPPGAIGVSLVKLGQWAWIKRRSRLPPYPFIVVTDDELIVFEFRFGSTLRLRRVVGRWPKSDIRVVKVSPDRRQATIVLPLSQSPVELEGAFHTEAEIDVVAQLQGLMRES
jgi:hypothetical protein